jgi:hypothetical protein
MQAGMIESATTQRVSDNLGRLFEVIEGNTGATVMAPKPRSNCFIEQRGID